MIPATQEALERWEREGVPEQWHPAPPETKGYPEYDPEQDRDPAGRWTATGVRVETEPRYQGYNDDETITLLHGTSAAHAALIRTHGFKRADHHAIANWIEDEFGLARDAIWSSPHYDFESKFRAGDETVYFTGQPEVARSYTVPESISDALGAAYIVMHPEWGTDADPDRGGRERFIKEQSARLVQPEILAVTIPWTTVREAFSGGKAQTWSFAEMRQQFPDLNITTIQIPDTKLRGVRVAPYAGTVTRGWSDETERLAAALVAKGYPEFDPSQPRADDGKWTDGGQGELFDPGAGTTPFRAWFAGSKVVDADGKPLVVYHRGTFDETEDGTLVIGAEGMHFGTLAAADLRQGGKAVDDFISEADIDQDADTGRWHWSSQGVDSWELEDPETPDDEKGFDTEADARRDLEAYAPSVSSDDVEPYELPLTKAYLVIRNPKRVPDQGKSWAAAIKKARAEGHDGLVYRNEIEDRGSTSWVVFSPGQVKSVKATTWDPNDPDITKHYGPGDHPSGSPQAVHGGDDGPSEAFHGTTTEHIEAILRDGLKASESGHVWPDMAKPNQVYFTHGEPLTPGGWTAERDAISWAMSALGKGGYTHQPLVLRLSIPAAEWKAHAKPDRNFHESDAGSAGMRWEYSGDIKPEWITAAWESGPDLLSPPGSPPTEYPDRWVRRKSAATAGLDVWAVVLVPMEKPKTKGRPEYRDDQPRDAGGRWSEEGAAPARPEYGNAPKPKAGAEPVDSTAKGTRSDPDYPRITLASFEKDGARNQMIREGELEPTDLERQAMNSHRRMYAKQCFDQSLTFLMNYGGEGARLVHGTYSPTDAGGLQYAHGWVELPGDRIFDGTLQRIFTRAAYEKYFRAKGERYYTLKEAMKMALRHKTYGAWHKSRPGVL